MNHTATLLRGTILVTYQWLVLTNPPDTDVRTFFGGLLRAAESRCNGPRDVEVFRAVSTGMTLLGACAQGEIGDSEVPDGWQVDCGLAIFTLIGTFFPYSLM